MTSKNSDRKPLTPDDGPEKSTDTPQAPWLRPQSIEGNVEFRQEYQARPNTKEEVEDEVLEAVKEAKEEEKPKIIKTKGELLRENRVLVNRLRNADDAHNRTCGACLRRKPIDDFARLKLSQVCTECE